MVSIKRHIAQGEETAAPHSAILLLLNGMATRAVRGDRSDFEAFQSDMERICGSADADVTALLVIAGSAVQAMESYRQRTTRFIQLAPILDDSGGVRGNRAHLTPDSLTAAAPRRRARRRAFPRA